MFEDYRLRVFETLVRMGSFTAASRELGISQPAVSQNIAELEKTLGEKLFDRNRGSVTLTDKGLLFKGYADQILHWYRVAESAFAGESVFDNSDPAQKNPVDLPLGDGKSVQIWTSQGDIHLTIK